MVLRDAQARAKTEDALADVASFVSCFLRYLFISILTSNSAIESNRLWVPLKPHPTLYYIWDVVQRSKYMLSEVSNIKEGKALKLPDQFRPAPGKGEGAAAEVFKDVCGRITMLQLLVTNSDRTAMMTGQPKVDFGPVVKEKVEALVKTLPERF